MNWLGGVIFLAACSILGLIFQAWLVMLLWNWIVVEVFHLAIINFGQSVGLCLLGSLITGSFVSIRQ